MTCATKLQPREDRSRCSRAERAHLRIGLETSKAFLHQLFLEKLSRGGRSRRRRPECARPRPAPPPTPRIIVIMVIMEMKAAT